MDQSIKNRFSVLPGYKHERDGIPIPQPMHFEFTILLDDIVMDAGEIQALNMQAAEDELQERYPDYNYVIGEVKKC